VPIPDPTTLTTEAVERATEVFRRELTALRETFEARFTALGEALESRRREFTGDLESARALIEQRLDGMDTAIALAARELDKFVGLLRAERDSRDDAEREFIMSQIEIIAVRLTEKFAAIDGQFAASKTAVDAALSAAKEAVQEQNKSNTAAIAVSEANTKEQIRALDQVGSASRKALDDKIDDARTRLTSIEERTRGIKESAGEGREEKGLRNSNVVVSLMAASMLVSLIAIIITIVLHK